MKLDRRSLVLLAIQLAIVSSIAAKYLYQRNTCPRVWTRAVAYDPDLVLRGRYLSMRLYVDACMLPPPQAAAAVAKAPGSPGYLDMADGSTFLQAKIGAQNGKLSILNFVNSEQDRSGVDVVWPHSNVCSEAQLWTPVDFYIPEHAVSPLAVGKQVWVEVTVPPKGPPRPLNLAINENGRWQPLQF